MSLAAKLQVAHIDHAAARREIIGERLDTFLEDDDLVLLFLMRHRRFQLSFEPVCSLWRENIHLLRLQGGFIRIHLLSLLVSSITCQCMALLGAMEMA